MAEPKVSSSPSVPDSAAEVAAISPEPERTVQPRPRAASASSACKRLAASNENRTWIWLAPTTTAVVACGPWSSMSPLAVAAGEPGLAWAAQVSAKARAMRPSAIRWSEFGQVVAAVDARVVVIAARVEEAGGDVGVEAGSAARFSMACRTAWWLPSRPVSDHDAK